LHIVRGYIVIGSLFLLFIEFKIELPRADTLGQVATRVRQRNAHLNQLQILYIGTHYLVVIVLYIGLSRWWSYRGHLRREVDCAWVFSILQVKS
jgi:hypothetical protein